MRILLSFLLLGASTLPLQAAGYDVVIRDGHVVDGTGSPWIRADVAVTGDRIVAIAPRIEGDAKREIQARGLVVAPGFIDLHTHARRGIFDNPYAENYVRQGVTTIFEGPDGGSPLPIRDFLRKLEEADAVPNMATFVGHGSIREEVIGRNDRAPTDAEMARMRNLVRQAMSEGAFGLSSGLIYNPGVFGTTEEVIELARVAGEMGGIYISHVRSESDEVVEAVAELVRIAEEAGVPAQITHHKVMGRNNEGKSVETLRLLHEARARGVDVTSDQYPFTASSTSLQAGLFPAWANEGGRDAMLKRLADPEDRRRIREYVIGQLLGVRAAGDPRSVQVAWAENEPSVAGKNLTEITLERGREPTVENAADTAIALLEAGRVRAIYHIINESDVARIMKDPTTMFASDGEVPTFGKDSPHPRSYGTNARVLAVYVREKKLLTLEEAIRKMTSFPAQRVGLVDRGLLRPGMKADIVVFDAATIRDRSTYDEPHQYAAGVSAVLVNGVVVFENGAMTGARPGEILLGTAAGEK